MLRYGINDIRIFYENDGRFLKPFYKPFSIQCKR